MKIIAIGLVRTEEEPDMETIAVFNHLSMQGGPRTIEEQAKEEITRILIEEDELDAESFEIERIICLNGDGIMYELQNCEE